MRQKTCGLDSCKQAHRAKYRRKYRKLNAEVEKEYQTKRNKQRPAGYWKEYRKDNPEYVKRNCLLSKLRRARIKVGLQRQLDTLELVEIPKNLEAVSEFATSTRWLWESDSATKSAITGVENENSFDFVNSA